MLFRVALKYYNKNNRWIKTVHKFDTSRSYDWIIMSDYLKELYTCSTRGKECSIIITPLKNESSMEDTTVEENNNE